MPYFRGKFIALNRIERNTKAETKNIRIHSQQHFYPSIFELMPSIPEANILLHYKIPPIATSYCEASVHNVCLKKEKSCCYRENKRKFYIDEICDAKTIHDIQ